MSVQPLEISVLSQMDPAFPRTHSIASIRLCAGLASQGHRVELVVPAIASSTRPPTALFDTYELEPTFAVRYLPVGRTGGKYGPWALRRLVGRHVARALRPGGSRIVISDGIRLILPYVAVARLRARRLVTAPWLHEFRGSRLEKFACANSACILATNTEISSDLAKQGISNQRTFVTGNAVPRERIEFGLRCSKRDARRRIRLDEQIPVIAYTGKLYLGQRELDYLLTAAERLPECLFLFTGGQPPVISELAQQLRERGIENVCFAGMLSEPEQTRFYQQAADVLVTYYSVEDLPHARHHIPSKLAEYMTTGNAIVAADYPAVRDLLNPGNSILVKPDDPIALTEALGLAIRDHERAVALGAAAQRDISNRSSETVGADLGGFLASVSQDRPGGQVQAS
jgi:glycosyltransferase involved in cell wall biosynthesis